MPRSRTTVPVWVDEWQYACCGEVFAVGDRVSWTLGAADLDFLGPRLGPHLPTWTALLPDRGTASAGDGREIVLAGAGDLWVALPEADRSSARHPVGLLTDERHHCFGEHVPPTVGRVRSIRTARRDGVVALRAVRSTDGEAAGVDGFLVELDVRS